MDISGKALREVEFRDRLRGYDTDEVDEFLEQVAIGVDELHAEVARAADRVARAERQAEELPVLDDEGIRRTLVLAQRTADLAIKEAQSEAAGIVEEARVTSEQLLAEAREFAQRQRSEAESTVQVLIERLKSEKQQLERQVETLHTLVDAERSRLTQALTSMLSLVGETFTVSESLNDIVVHDESARRVEVEDSFSLDLAEIDEEISAGEEPPLTFPTRVAPVAPMTSTPVSEDVLDPDEELWERWAKSAAEFGDDDTSEDPFRFGQGEDKRPS